MNLSLNEVEALAKKATRGAGYPWGLAEEAGMATRWLCARDVDGCTELARLLEQCDGTKLSDWSPDVSGDVWSPVGRKLCPITTGAAMSDHADGWADNTLQMEDVAQPFLLAPFAGASAKQLNRTVEIFWDGAVLSTDGDDLSIAGETHPEATRVSVKSGGTIGTPTQRCTRAVLPKEGFETLTKFAQRTYAPATEESRIKGAGAGLSDND